MIRAKLRNQNISDLWIILGAVIGVVLLAFLAIGFQAWILGIILGWFNVSLGFWKCFLIVFLVNSLVSAGSKS